jgi:hypothetical protein
VPLPQTRHVDCFRFRNKIGVDLAVEALAHDRRTRSGTADELWRVADQFIHHPCAQTPLPLEVFAMDEQLVYRDGCWSKAPRPSGREEP